MILTVSFLASVVSYGSQVQQPMRATAIVGSHPQTHCAAQFGREQGRAGSLHPGGVPCPCQNGRKTAVTSGQPRAIRTAADLRMRRLTPA